MAPLGILPRRRGCGASPIHDFWVWRAQVPRGTRIIGGPSNALSSLIKPKEKIRGVSGLSPAVCVVLKPLSVALLVGSAMQGVVSSWHGFSVIQVPALAPRSFSFRVL